MSKTKIEWCARPGTIPEVWNVVTGCNKVSQGCKNCYAEKMHRRLQVMHPKKYYHPFFDGAHVHEDLLPLPLTWKKPRTVFVNSMSDLFHESIPFEFIDKVFAVMGSEQCKYHTFQILTKRPARMLEYFKWLNERTWNYPARSRRDIPYEDDRICNYLQSKMDDIYGPFKKENTLIMKRWPFKNVWLGVSIEDQQTADERIPLLLQVPAGVRFLSCEPLLGPIDLVKSYELPHPSPHIDAQWVSAIHCVEHSPKVHWVIAGGESGHKARAMHPGWVKNILNQCNDYGVPFFFKQWGEWRPYAKGDSSIFDQGTFVDKVGEWNDYPPGFFVDGIMGMNWGTCMSKTGKKKASRSLYGVEYNHWPEL